MNEIRPEDVVAFWRHMQAHYGTQVVNKADSVEMQAVAVFLNAIGVLDRERFLKNFTTTIGRRIYVPFEIGSRDRDLWGQIVICTHEHQHVVQSDLEPGFEALYITDKAARARFEAEAYQAQLELHFWRHGATAPVRPLAELLGNAYGCRPEDVEVAAQSLALANISIRQGAVLNQATKVALDWLNANVPRLRGQ